MTLVPEGAAGLGQPCCQGGPSCLRVEPQWSLWEGASSLSSSLHTAQGTLIVVSVCLLWASVPPPKRGLVPDFH